MPEGWAAAHTRLALGVNAVTIALAVLLPSPDPALELALLAVLVGLLGLPHGAVDHLQGRTLFAPRFGRAWPAAFAAAYVGAAALVVTAWFAWPPGLLIVFLVLATGHFGAEDIAAARLTAPGRATALAESALRGALPVVLAVTFHPTATAGHFAALMPATHTHVVTSVVTALAPAGLAYLALLLGYAAAAIRRRRPDLALETAALLGVFAALPPLLAFAVYFGIWHAPRHSLAVMAEQGAPGPAAGIRSFVRAAAPLTAVTLILAGAAWWLRRPEAGADAATLQVVFIGLAALTVPHVGLAALRERARAHPAGARGLNRS